MTDHIGNSTEVPVADTLPVHFPLGRNSVEFITEPHQRVLAEIATWRTLSESRTHDEPAAKPR
jgi:hypothetical protein